MPQIAQIHTPLQRFLHLPFPLQDSNAANALKHRPSRYPSAVNPKKSVSVEEGVPAKNAPVNAITTGFFNSNSSVMIAEVTPK